MEKAYIHETSVVNNCTLSHDTKVWKNVYLKNVITNGRVSIGDNSRIEDSIFLDSVNLQRNAMIYGCSLGRYTYTGRNFVAWHSKIGSFCSISWNVSLGGGEHDYHRVTSSAFLYSDIFDLRGDHKGYNRFTKECEIGNDVWIGCNVVVCRGVKIGNGAVIAAGAVVTKDVEPYTIVGGVPAKLIKKRYDNDICERMKKIKWWDLPSNVIKDNYDLFDSYPTHMLLNKLEQLVYQYNQDNDTI